MAILFYKISDKYGCFSNFAPYGFEYDGLYWATSEHFFQAHKFVGTELFEKVRLANSPMEAAKIGRDRRNRLRADWEDDMSLYPMKAKFIKGNING